MNSLRLALLSLISILLLCSCASQVTTDVNSFRADDFPADGSTMVVEPSNPEFNNSLEFKHYRVKLESRLKQAGYKIVDERRAANYLVKLGYHISDGQVRTETSPVTGNTGYESVIYSTVEENEDGSKDRIYRTRWIPTYGIVGSTTRTFTNFVTLITLEIVELKNPVDTDPATVFELKARSEGTCGMISQIFDEMLEAIFRDFPGDNNRVDKISVKADENCYPSD